MAETRAVEERHHAIPVPWSVQQTEPDVWTVMDADGEEIWTVGQWEVEEARMVVALVNAITDALGEALYLLDDVSGLEDHPTLAKARKALRSVGREVIRGRAQEAD